MTPGRPRSRSLAAVAALLLLVLPSAGALAAEGKPERIEKIVIQGNEFMSTEAVQALTDLEVGDEVDDQALRREWLKLWQSNLFDDLRIDAAAGEQGGQVVIVQVREKPRIDTVSYEKVKAITQERLDEVLADNDADLVSGATLDQERVSKTKRLIEEMLAAEGYPDGRVTIVQRRVARSRVSLDFKIDQGPKLKIDEITFSGNTVYSTKALKGMLRQTEEAGLLSMWSKKTVFYRPRLEEDLKNVQDAYRAKGYIAVQVGEPVIQDARPGKSGKEEKRFVTLVVPITEGDQYRLGKMAISGNSVFGTDDLRRLVPVGEGEVLNDSLVKLGIQRIDNRYGDEGYFYAVSSPRYYPDPATKACDVEIEVTENDQYTIRRIEFDGNTLTRDEVLRRELRVSEGEVFSRRDFQVGVRKIAQLGFWELDGEPIIEPADNGKKELDITVRGKEVGRNEIQFGGGFSGVDGFFATFSFSSRNFMGRGSQLSVSGQIGGSNTRYSLTYQEPYIFKTRGTLGASIFARDQEYDGFDREGKGVAVSWSHPTSTFSAFRATARWENSRVVGDSNVEDDEFVVYSLTPAWFFDNRDNPFRPTRGRRFNTEIALGNSRDTEDELPDPFQEGTVRFVRPEFGYTQYWRTKKTQYFGMHVEGGLVRPVSGNDNDNYPSDGIDPPYLPVFERSFLGGETSIRGVESRSVGPHVYQYRGVGAGGAPSAALLWEDVDLGGDAYYLVNLEYNIPLNSVFEITPFVDLGNAFGVDHVNIRDLLTVQDDDVIVIEDSDPFDVKATAGLELRFHTPVLQQPLRLIYGCKVAGEFYDDNSTCSFQFSIGRTFQ